MIARIMRTWLWTMLVLLSAHRAWSHPLGNFSISQYSALRVGQDSLTVRYIIDMAEIPTFQELQESGIMPVSDDPRVQAYLAKKVDTLRDGLFLEINGRRLKLYAESKEITFSPGAGGLPTLKIGVSYEAKFTAAATAVLYSIDYRDGNFAGRAGWKEVIANAGPSINILGSSVPHTDRSAQLSDYPTDLLNSPPQQLAARLEYTVPATAARPVAATVPPMKDDTRAAGPSLHYEKSNRAPRREAEDEGETPPRSMPNDSFPVLTAAPENRDIPLQGNKSSTPRDSFTELIAAPDLGWNVILIALAVALGLGAFHALEPGHGKTLVAAYLVGSRGTMKHALLLGLIVTAAHTAGVYLLAGIALYAAQHVVPERLYPWLEIVSGLAIAILGAMLFVKRSRGKSEAQAHHHHDHGRHSHPHDHVHERGHHGHHGQHHHHGTASWRELLTLGISGGIVPCPAALVVLLSGVSMNRAGFGLILIVAFSAGLAAVLIAIGMLMVYARHFMTRFQSEGKWVTRWLPITSSAFIMLLGFALVWQALQTMGLTQWQL